VLDGFVENPVLRFLHRTTTMLIRKTIHGQLRTAEENTTWGRKMGAFLSNSIGLFVNHFRLFRWYEAMFRMVARLRVPYILMSVQKDLHDTLMAFASKVQMLRDFGQKDIILDPGFGFGKTLDENYRLMAEMEKLQVFELPILVGISRKSMIYKLLETSPAEALNGTTFLNTIALMKGASILRVHDVKEAVEIVKMYDRIRN
jgi:dihydropteroate synthase